ncbi:MAG: 2-amino-4-hydroxy-6-hydroxymethyldihydropteridine diphosphokinase [Candidatus Puniceispirillum sp.]|nr:2-amino-4-hydroxy-6-hydroxymethyldihydropteridine diphosphokinase [Candidatus Pelagibacter sp.]MBA4283362.1 2-amino-4-hydroxy-6-hydroxymethyldihydropteridine diphosphokinase [Candidatus Puniceispirillum sp.]
MNKVIFALGTNVGDKPLNLNKSKELLDSFLQNTYYSSVIETEPQYELNQDSFLNQVGYGYTDSSPEEVLQQFKIFENKIGRTPTYRFGPREIDIDILFYEDHIINSPDLVIPHPRLYERSFVLAPLNEIEPEWICPNTRKTIQQLHQELVTISTD